jgi:alpha-mannosidase
MGNDHIPTSVLALFPGQKSVWVETLRRMTQFTTGLGKFVDIEEYFQDTAHTGGMHRFGYDKYPIDSLTFVRGSVNPLSQWNELYRNSLNRQVQSSLETLLSLLNKPIDETPLPQQFAETLTNTLTEPPTEVGGNTPSIVINPLSFPRKTFVNDTAVDVPPLGYAFIEPSPQAAESIVKKSLLGQFFAAKKEPLLARKTEDDMGRGSRRAIYLLENKYFSAKFDAQTGSLRSIFTNRSRFNQLSQQIAFYKNQTYTIQAADEIVMMKSSVEVGQIKITGRLVFPDGEIAARYTETATIRSESRLLEFDVTLEPMIEFDEDRWNSYLAVRYAWNDDTYEQRGGLNDGVHTLPDRKHLHSPKFIDLRHEGSSLTLLTEGLPFHRRSGDRQLDTLLMVHGETQQHHRLGIGVNMPNPVFVSHDFLLPYSEPLTNVRNEYVIPVSHRPKNPSSWLFQIESKNVMALHWEPIHESEQCIGLMVYLQETSGRRVHFALRSFLPPKSAAAMNFQGKELKTFKIQDDAVLIDMHPHELLPLMIKTKEQNRDL